MNTTVHIVKKTPTATHGKLAVKTWMETICAVPTRMEFAAQAESIVALQVLFLLNFLGYNCDVQNYDCSPKLSQSL